MDFFSDEDLSQTSKILLKLTIATFFKRKINRLVPLHEYRLKKMEDSVKTFFEKKI